MTGFKLDPGAAGRNKFKKSELKSSGMGADDGVVGLEDIRSAQRTFRYAGRKEFAVVYHLFKRIGEFALFHAV